MKINELETFLGISKQTIIHYQEAGLLQSCKQDENDIFTKNDILLLSLIKYFRNLDIPLEDIKLILNQKINLNDYIYNHFND